MRRLALVCFGITLSLFAGRSLYAQGYLYQIGTPAFTTQIPIENGFINVNNGELHIEIPLAQNTQRGSMQLNERLVYDSRIWQIVDSGGNYSWAPTNVPNSMGGWRFSSGIETGTTSYYLGTPSTVTCPSGTGTMTRYPYAGFEWTDPSGTAHRFTGLTYQYEATLHSCLASPNGSLGSQPTTSGYASDGSGYTMTVSNYTNMTVFDPSGIEVYPTLTDQSGNYFSTDSSGNLVDTVGQTPVITSTSGNRIFYDVLTYNGTRSRYTVTTETVNYGTAFGQAAVAEVQGSFTAIQSITFPDGSIYSFTYQHEPPGAAYGEINSVTLPAGGVITYGFTNYEDSFQNQNRWLHTRVKDGGTTTFSPSTISYCTQTAGCQEKTVVTSPSGDDTVYTFSLDSGASQVLGRSWTTNIVAYSGSSAGSGVAVKGVASGYTYAEGALPYGPVFYLPTAVTSTTTLYDASVASQVQTTLDYTGSKPITVSEWDYYSASGTPPSTPTRTTNYGYWSGNLPQSVTVADGSGNVVSKSTYGYNETTGTGHAPVVPVSGLPQQPLANNGGGANLTTMSQWINTTGTTLSTMSEYDAAGTMLNSTAPDGTTLYAYDSSDTFPISITPPTPLSGISLALSAQTDLGTGLPSSQTDANGSVQSYKTYDSFGRVTELDGLDAGSNILSKKTFSYTPTSQSAFTYQSSSVYEDMETQYDAYGRTSRVAVANGRTTNPWNQQDTCYDTRGNVNFKSYSYQGTEWTTAKVCSGAGDSFTYDALGRIQTITHGDGSGVTYTYVGRAAKIVDENGVTKISQVDGLGRTTAVCEISATTTMPNSGAPQSCGLDIAGTGFLTISTYNLANHTTTVTQGAQTRIFQTDSLGRTVLVTEPESGTTTYSYAYNSTGLVVTRTKPQANQTGSTTTMTTTQYDAVGRVVSVVYSDGITPSKKFSYDMATGWNSASLGASKGNLTYASTSSSTGTLLTGTQFTYDAMGRVSATAQCLPTRCANLTFNVQRGYGYNWASEQTSDSYYLGGSNGTLVTTNYPVSPLGSAQSISNSLTGLANDNGSIISNVQNGAFGPVSYNYGNGLNAVVGYDGLGRLSGLWLCNGSTQSGCTGGTQQYGFDATWKGTQVQALDDSVLNSHANLGYDEFNRLKAVAYTTRAQAFSYVYDRYGNRWQQNVTQGSGSMPQHSFSASTNQISGYSYDAAGNLISDGTHSYTYDAEGNLISVDNCATAGYVYDALNNRVQSVANGTNSLYAYNLSNQRASIWDGDSSTPQLISAATYWGGQPVAYFDGYTTTFQHQDGQGTERMRTGVDGSVLGNYQSLAFGDQMSSAGSDNDPYHYAQLDFDVESWTDHAQFRQYSETSGGWMQPDPYSGSYDFSNPQSFNRYAYVMNNPLVATDPSGLDGEGGSNPPIPGGCIGAAESGGQAIPADVICGVQILIDIFDFFGGGPSFNGSLQPRPNGQIWDEHSPVHPNPDIARALGLPDGGCEFGACGFMRGAGAYNSSWSQAQKLAYVLQTVALLNVSGLDNKIIACVITDEEDPRLDPSAVNGAGGGFGAIGLMQVRQGSLNDVNRVYGLSGGYTQNDLSNPQWNVFIGSSNIGNHVRYAHGNVWEGIRTAGDGTQGYVNRIKRCSGNAN